ncbi:MAG: acetylxylan esterase [Gemmataceae bacterium]|nr:acetylxylan esterase [Gemmata sp.]MDW8197695.1 acetylxylan esterase [Gemmataceae bacterium]
MRTTSLTGLAILSTLALAADFKDLDPRVVAATDPQAKDLSQMMLRDAQKRLQDAHSRESRRFAEITTRSQWEAYRDERIAKLKAALGAWPEPPHDLRIVVTNKLDGEGFTIHNLLYESRPGWWVSANLYQPATRPEKMPGIIISHSHHTPKTHGELQDMGMTWARAGVAVLVPDHLGHGERRQHDFLTEKDYDKPFRVSRQDYYFRYNTNLQLSALGESLMGWMVWDLMRGVDVLLKQPNIDPKRLILLGAVAGGGDPAGVTAALDPRIACVVPFNFGGWQPESRVLDNPDRDFAWFGDGYWESTRGLRYGARDGFAHFVIVGSVAPRKVIYAHEFAWDAKTDPAWPRLQKIFAFYDAPESLRVVHGRGAVTGPAGPDNTHCTHIGAVHRRGIHTALQDWFAIPIPQEYSRRRAPDELLCWNSNAIKDLKPKMLHEWLAHRAQQLAADWQRTQPAQPAAQRERLRRQWATLLGTIEPVEQPKVTERSREAVPGGTLSRWLCEVEPGIVVPFLLLVPQEAHRPVPVVVMVSSRGKQAFFPTHSEAIAAFLKAGIAVCLPDVRGTGETQPGSSAARSSTRTSIAQTNLILGQPVLGSQLRDLRTILRWLSRRPEIDGQTIAVWGEGTALRNEKTTKLAVPLDASNFPHIAEPGAPLLALLAGLYEDSVAVVYTHGGLAQYASLFDQPYIYVPHDAVVPGIVTVGDIPALVAALAPRPVRYDDPIDAGNRRMVAQPSADHPRAAAKFITDQLRQR